MARFLSSPFRTILLSGLIAGTLDISAAIVFLGKLKAAAVLKYVASGAFGKAAYAGDSKMIISGLLFHYLIAFTIATIYFFIYPRLKFLHANKLFSAVLIGGCAWAFMSFIVVPNSQIGPSEFNPESAAKNILILIVCIGLPISIITSEHFNSRRKA